MLNWTKFQPSSSGQWLLIATAFVLPTLALFLAMFITLPPTSRALPPSGGWGGLPPSQVSPQTDLPWNIHLYASPTSPDGVGLWAFTGETSNICQKVTFNAEFLGVPTPFAGAYDPDENIYIGFLDSFFAPGTDTQVGSLEVVCDLATGDRLVTNPIIFTRYHFDGTEMTIPSDDGRAKLTLNSNSLNPSHYIIVMSTNALPTTLPLGVKAIGLPYSFRTFVTTPHSDGPMLLNLIYQGLLGQEDPLTLRILTWDVATKSWLDSGDQGLSVLGEARLNKTTAQFTTYILGSTPRWLDSFTTGIGLATKDNIKRIPVEGKLTLDTISGTGLVTGTAISLPYTPTMPIRTWQTVSYTANIPAGTSLAVSVLGQNYEILKANVTPGQSLTGIDPALHPSLSLRVDMSTTSTSSPELFDWSLLVEPAYEQVYLPIIIR